MKRWFSVILALACAISFSVVPSARVVTADEAQEAVDNAIASISPYIQDILRSLTLDEDGVRVYEDPSDDVMEPGKTVYVIAAPTGIGGPEGDLVGLLSDDDVFSFKFDKDKNAKMVKKVEVAEKKLPSSVVPAGRYLSLKFVFNDTYSDEEFQITGDAEFKLKKALFFDGGSIRVAKSGDKELAESNDSFIYLENGVKIVLPVKFWVSNTEQVGDQDYLAGTGGVVVKPEKNEDNEVNWEDANHPLARLTFTADSDVSTFYPKLSTKWEEELIVKFEGQDAYIRSFVGNPTISSTSRATLELYNPFVDEDGETTIDPEEVVIYEVIDGELVNATAKFTATVNDDGDPVFITKTRTLGTYILAEAETIAIAQAQTGDEEVIEIGLGKVVPDTGR